MSLDDLLLRAKEEYDKNPNRVRPRMFQDGQEQQIRQKKLIASGHLDKQQPCHCGSFSACHAYVCGNCGTERRHQNVVLVEKYENGWIKHIFHRACPNCGATKWLFMCEARVVRRVAGN